MAREKRLYDLRRAEPPDRVSSTSTPVSDFVIADSGSVTIKQWMPMAAGEQALVNQFGSSADGASHPAAIVQPLPSLSIPSVVGSVPEGAATVWVDKVTPGARATLFVNGVTRSRLGPEQPDHEACQQLQTIRQPQQITRSPAASRSR